MWKSYKTFARTSGAVCLLTVGAASGIFTSRAVGAQQAEDGTLKLGAADAQIEGPNARIDGGDEKNVIWWTNMDTSLHWSANIQKPGKYRVELNYCVVGNNNGSKLAITVGDQKVEAMPKAGTGLNDYKIGRAGTVTIGSPSELPITIKPMVKGREFVINVRSLELVPEGTPSKAIDVSGAAIQQAEDGSFTLPAQDAEIEGMNAELENYDPKNIGYWKAVDTSIKWAIHVQKPGKFRVEMDYALLPDYEGAKVAVIVGDQEVKAKPKAGKGWRDYRVGRIGEVTLAKEGDLTVELTPLSKPHDFLINFRSVRLIPAEVPGKALDISDKPIAPAPDGSIKLDANNVEINGLSARLEGGEKKYVTWRNGATGFVRWPIKVEKPGTYTVQMTYALGETDNSSDVELEIGGKKVAGTLKPGRNLDDYKTVKLGEIAVDKTDGVEAVLTSSKEAGHLVMNLRGITLTPARKK